MENLAEDMERLESAFELAATLQLYALAALLVGFLLVLLVRDIRANRRGRR